MKNANDPSGAVPRLQRSTPAWQKSERIKFRILIPLGLAMAILLGAFIFAFHEDQQQKSAREIDRVAQEAQKLLRLQQEQKAAVMVTTIQAILNDEKLGEAFRSRDREKLLERAAPLYDTLSRQHKITHFYFHTPDRTNLLRAHRPAQHGDVINRFTLREAERVQFVTSGIERGPIGTFVLRVVSPWRREGELLGYIELGMEFEDILKETHGLLNVDFVAAVYKKFLDREQWNKALKTYGKEASWDQFPSTVVMDKTVDAIPAAVAAYLSAPEHETNVTNHVASWRGAGLQLLFLPLTDVAGKNLGELIVLHDVTASVAQARSSMRFIALICFAVGALLFGLFYLFLSRVEVDLADRTSKLKAEINERQRAEEELRQAHDQLEARVEERTSALKEANVALCDQIGARERAQSQLEAASRRLIETSRLAGMAEVATGVLHNVGNVLNSVNVTATLLTESLRKSRVSDLDRAVALLNDHSTDLAAFLTADSRGQKMPEFLSRVAERLHTEQASHLKELESLRQNIEHIKDIVAMQQSYAKVSGVIETIQVIDLVEDALRMNAGSFTRHRLNVTRDFEAVPPVPTDKHKVLQILVNLVRNAKYACDESGKADKELTVRVRHNNDRVTISVMDNGAGIAADNLNRIFNHGFTTKKDGHGFGLHSGALAAKELGGSLSACSDGPGQGAIFTLALPLNPAGRNTAPSMETPPLAA